MLALAVAVNVFVSFDMLWGKGKPIIHGNDDAMYFFWLRSSAIDHDVNFENELRESGMMDESAAQDILASPRTATGKVPNKYWIGLPLLNSLVYLPVLKWTQIFSAHVTGYEPHLLLSIWLFQLGLAACSLVLVVKLAARFSPGTEVIPWVILVWLASPLIYYQTGRLGMVHGQLFFLTVSAFSLSVRLTDRDARFWHWPTLGLACGFLVVTRATSVVYLIFPLVCVITARKQHGSTSYVVRLLVAGFFASIPLVIQMFCWNEVFGSWIADSYGGERFNFAGPQIASVLFSDHHGFFNWHPFLLLGLPALALFAKHHRAAGLSWLVSILLVVYLNAAWWCPSFGSSFGNRSFEDVVLIFMLCIPFAAGKIHNHLLIRRLVIATGCLAVVWNFYLLAGFLEGSVSKIDPVSYSARFNWCCSNARPKNSNSAIP